MWVQLPPLQPFMLRVAQMVRAPGCGPGGRRFETGHAPHGFLAQLVERQTEDLRVPGPIPGEPTTYGRMPESGQLGRTVNPLPQGCVGSNPTSPTIKYNAQFLSMTLEGESDILPVIPGTAVLFRLAPVFERNDRYD